ncbi:Beta-13-galactosyl-O-glycosyl-glycoprotein beta-16-N-acetylglucosaminyltransferase 4, partial [Taenia solium]
MITRPNGDVNAAFTLVVHKDVLQIARLLRMIYRVNNHFCIHLDARSSQQFQEAIQGVVACFAPSVGLVSVEWRGAVHWPDESILMSQL